MRTPLRIGTALVAVALMALGTTACTTEEPLPPLEEGQTEITVRGCTPQNPMIASNTNEVCGGNILDASEAKLVHYNADNAAPELDVAESIESPDAINWTVKLKQGYMYQDGTEIKAHNFVDTWNWAANDNNAQMNEFFFEMIEGYNDVKFTDPDCEDDACETAAETMSGLAVVDDYTFTIKTYEPTSNLLVRLGYTVFAPQPDAFFADTSAGKVEFAQAPIAAGPYQITSVSDTAIVIEKFADYSGAYAGSVDRIVFKIYNDANAAYTDVVANNLDVTDLVPADSLVGDVWKTDLVADDGSPRWGTKATGIFQGMTFSPETTDPGMADVRIRQAISMAIDRDEIVDVVFNNARKAADSWGSPVVDGYKPGQCTNCVFDKEKAKELYDAAGGYPGPLELWVNGDGGHEAWSEAVCNQIKNNLDLECVVQTTPDFKTLRDRIGARELKGIMRAGWQMDYPSIENFMTPLYATGASANDGDYSNPEFDRLMRDAAAASTNEQANLLYQQAQDLLNKDFPVMPMWTQESQFGYSTKVKSIKMTPFSTFDFSTVELAS